MRLVRYLKPHLKAVVLVVLLLGIQAFADLALPRYTSDIVDVGIQQSGIEHVSPEALRASSFEIVCSQLSEGDVQSLTRAYELGDDGVYHLTEWGADNRDLLDGVMEAPFAALVSGASADASASADAGDTTSTSTSASTSVTASENMREQQALAATQAEYEALGYSLSDMQTAYLWRMGIEMLIIAAIGMIVAIGVGFIASRTAADIATSLRKRLYTTVLSFSPAEVNRFSAASLITRGTNDIQQIQMVETMLLRMVLYAPILAIGGIIMVATTNISMGWVILLAIAALFLIIMVLMRITMPKFKIMQYLVDDVNRAAREMLTGLSVIRAFNRQDYEQERFDVASLKLKDTQLFTNRVMTFMMPLLTMVMNLTSVAIVWVGGHYVDRGAIQTGDLIAFITYSMVVIMSFLIMGMISVMLPRANVAAERVDEVLATSSSIVDVADVSQEQHGFDTLQTSPAYQAYQEYKDAHQSALTPHSAAVSHKAGAKIEFQNVSFRYSDTSEYVLEQVSFVAPAGKTTAIIGSTGSGKTSICRLIERFYDVSSGAVLVDGRDVRDVPLDYLRAQIAFVPQKAFLFSGSIASNVGYSEGLHADALDTQTKARISRALDIAQASAFVDESSDGVARELSQGGSNVSGGQRQRLAIARALFADARAYVFDDSFSALDYRTEAELRHQMAHQLANATVVVVAQRIATVMHADQVVVLDEGRVVGIGNHKTLLASCKEYREIAQSQLSPSELEGGGLQ